MTTPQKVLIAGFLAAITGAGIYQRIQIQELRDENETLRQYITDQSEVLSRYLAIRRIRITFEGWKKGPNQGAERPPPLCYALRRTLASGVRRSSPGRKMALDEAEVT